LGQSIITCGTVESFRLLNEWLYISIIWISPQLIIGPFQSRQAEISHEQYM
jgi:hypothetical protein